jgi:hypothetical protein
MMGRYILKLPALVGLSVEELAIAVARPCSATSAARLTGAELTTQPIADSGDSRHLRGV